MDIIDPTDAELASLRAEHAHRFPQKAIVRVAGDGGVEVALTVLLGNPSGACKMPNPDLTSPAWDALAAATFKVRDDDDVVTQLAADCVLWPNEATWFSWTKRWAALPELIQVAIRRKTGAAQDMVVAPPAKTERPAALVPLFVRHPGAVWRQFTSGAEVVDLAVGPPDFGSWRVFKTAMKARDAQHGQLVRDVVGASLLAAVRADGTPVDVDTLLGRWCGLSLSLGVTVSYLAGLTGTVELGE